MRSSPSGPDPLDPGPQGFAHRGLHYGPGFPENSLLSFAAALEMGAGIECDLRLTADNHILVFHDPDAMRICGSPLRIGQNAWQELSRLSVGEHPIPTLESLFALVARRVPLLLEIKVEKDLWRWKHALGPALSAYSGQFGVMSFDPRISKILKENMPKIRRGLVIRDRLSPLRRCIALWLADPQFVAVNKASLGERWVSRLRGQIPVYAWTIRTAAERAQAEVQADGLIWEGDGRPGI